MEDEILIPKWGTPRPTTQKVKSIGHDVFDIRSVCIVFTVPDGRG